MKRSALRSLRLYPHFKLTDEKFPRLLSTRRVDRDGSEYFGAFLPESGARILLDFVNRIFQLRSCIIDIENGLAVPCPMFYSQRCLAPCVANICDEEKYLERVEVLRHFLADRRGVLKQLLAKHIKNCADALDFERAAEWRDLLNTVESYWNNKHRKHRLDLAVDTWNIVEERTQFIFNLVTQRGRRVLGSRTFELEKSGDDSVGKVAGKLFSCFYRVYAPKEIRVFEDFDSRAQIARMLSSRFGRHVKILVQNELTPTTKKGLRQLGFASAIKNVAGSKSLKNLQTSLKNNIKLKRIPKRIEAYDVAHTSGEHVVTSRVVWESGQFLNDQNAVWQFEALSEPQAIIEAIRRRFIDNETRPDLIMIDGGKGQLNAALQGLPNGFRNEFRVISAVKPRGRHNEIAYFLDEGFNRIEITDRDAFLFLTNLRDKSHDLANVTHARARDKNHYYTLALVLPTFGEQHRRELLRRAGSIEFLRESNLQRLRSMFDADTATRIVKERRSGIGAKGNASESLVPIRFDAEGGDAKDLQPISPKARY